MGKVHILQQQTDAMYGRYVETICGCSVLSDSVSDTLALITCVRCRRINHYRARIIQVARPWRPVRGSGSRQPIQ